MLGPQWTKEELERFYEAYCKYGKDWKKVATMIHNRSVEMVEALYTMNRAYLSLPDGTASVTGLIAMMTDHYCVMGVSDSEQESNEGMGASWELQKCSRGKLRDEPSKSLDKPLPDLLQFHSAASSYGCLSLLKRRRSESRPHAVGKRTTCVPIYFSQDKNKGERYFSPIRQRMKLKVDAIDDDVAHEVALTLTEASQRGGSPQVSQTPNRKAETPSPVLNSERMNAGSETTSAKIHGSEVDEDACELSLGSTEADNADYVRDKNCSRNIEGTGTDEVQQKGKRYYRRKPEVEKSVNNHLEDTKEACSGTEGQKLCDFKGKFDAKVADAKTSRASKVPRKRSKKVLFGGVEDTSFDALQTLADLSLMMPETAADTGMDNQDLWRDLAHREKAKGKCPLETSKNDPKARQVSVPLPRIVIGGSGSRRSTIRRPASRTTPPPLRGREKAKGKCPLETSKNDPKTRQVIVPLPRIVIGSSGSRRSTIRHPASRTTSPLRGHEKAKGKCPLETSKNDPKTRQVIVPLPSIVIGSSGSRRSTICPPKSRTTPSASRGREKAKGKCPLETSKNDPKARQVIVPLPRIVIGGSGSGRSTIRPPALQTTPSPLRGGHSGLGASGGHGKGSSQEQQKQQPQQQKHQQQ